ncbi:hypothetical protein AWU65_07050 [Paenibacillus glucanolyticus]|uniref:Uncharacterized protein n=1 Tax=Paenibacillus glucanolyticus TaxID=59843 RepID=A0A163HVR2_9BACL|nr:hypothetical protein [Paenibacillus glucanolyticus]KZS45685.1 hypothetical protein AWU65_07050 [Paenibacillus glucanolyticus]
MNYDERLNKMESQIIELKFQLKIMQSIVMCKPPEWAEAALKTARENGMHESPYGGGLDYYRLISYLNAKGIL